MIDVGIQENVQIDSVELRKDPGNDPLKDALVITMSIADNSDQDLMASLVKAEETVTDGNEQEYYLWPFDTLDRDGNPAPLKEILKRLKDFKAQLTHMLSGYMVKETVEQKWNDVVFNNTGITNDNIETKLLEPTVLNQVYKNVCNGFIELMSPYAGQSSAPKFRVKLIRQSKAKHFSRLPKYAPFWEPMEIKPDQSKLAFSKWEKENGFDSGKPAEDVPTPDAGGGDPQQAKEAADVFGA